MANIGQVKTIRESILLGDTEVFLEKKTHNLNPEGTSH